MPASSAPFPRVARGLRSLDVEKSPDALGLGIIGLNEGRTAAVAALTRTRHVRLAALCDSDPARLTALQDELGLGSEVATTQDPAALVAMPGVDVVAIYTPDASHADLVALALRAGKAVLCTKPLINTVAGARAVAAAAREHGDRVMVGQSSRFFEPMRAQRARFEAGEYGAVELVEAQYLHRMDWYYDGRPWIAADTDWMFLGLSHPLDLLAWYLPTIVSVSAFGSRSSLAAKAGLEGFDIYSVTVTTEDGRLGRALGHYGAHELPSARNSIECLLWGSDGTSLAQYHDMKLLEVGPDGVEHQTDYLYEKRHYYFNNEVHGMHYGEFANYLDHFAGALLRGEPWSPNLTEGLNVFALMEAARRSALAGGVPLSPAAVLAEVLS